MDFRTVTSSLLDVHKPDEFDDHAHIKYTKEILKTVADLQSVEVNVAEYLMEDGNWEFAIPFFSCYFKFQSYYVPSHKK